MPVVQKNDMCKVGTNARTHFILVAYSPIKVAECRIVPTYVVLVTHIPGAA